MLRFEPSSRKSVVSISCDGRRLSFCLQRLVLDYPCKLAEFGHSTSLSHFSPNDVMTQPFLSLRNKGLKRDAPQPMKMKEFFANLRGVRKFQISNSSKFPRFSKRFSVTLWEVLGHMGVMFQTSQKEGIIIEKKEFSVSQIQFRFHKERTPY